MIIKKIDKKDVPSTVRVAGRRNTEYVKLRAEILNLPGKEEALEIRVDNMKVAARIQSAVAPLRPHTKDRSKYIDPLPQGYELFTRTQLVNGKGGPVDLFIWVEEAR